MLPAHATYRLTNILLRKVRITAYTCRTSVFNAFGNQAVNGLARITTKPARLEVSKISGLATRRALSSEPEANSCLDNATYERVCVQTLDALCDYFEELTENAPQLSGSDVSYGDGVLTINLGNENGTYVINRQSPNKQIWLSSPTSGPKRYDFVGTSTGEHGKWIYKHTGESLHELLQTEIPKILNDQTVNFLQLSHSS